MAAALAAPPSDAAADERARQAWLAEQQQMAWQEAWRRSSILPSAAQQQWRPPPQQPSLFGRAARPIEFEGRTEASRRETRPRTVGQIRTPWTALAAFCLATEYFTGTLDAMADGKIFPALFMAVGFLGAGLLFDDIAIGLAERASARPRPEASSIARSDLEKNRPR